MREILFRGKGIDTNEWRYGAYYNGVHGEGLSKIYEPHKEFIIDEHTEVFHRVRSETVGQYTGLKDKEGNKIFIGDLIQKEHNSLQRPQEEVFRVRELDIGGYVIENKNDFGYLYNHNDNSKVIGNTTDNPELLEEESK